MFELMLMDHYKSNCKLVKTYKLHGFYRLLVPPKPENKTKRTDDEHHLQNIQVKNLTQLSLRSHPCL